MQRGLSYRKAVCPSVKRVNCDKTNEGSADILIPYESSIHLVFRHEEWLVGRLLLPKMLGQTDHTASKMAISNWYALIAPQPLHLVKKSSIITNRKSSTGFPMSLIWTAYVTPKPAKGGSKTQSGCFLYKSGLLSKKGCYKVTLCENFQRQSYKVFTGLSIRAQMVGRGCRFLLDILGQIDQPLEKRRLQIDIRL